MPAAAEAAARPRLAGPISAATEGDRGLRGRAGQRRAGAGPRTETETGPRAGTETETGPRTGTETGPRTRARTGPRARTRTRSRSGTGATTGPRTGAALAVSGHLGQSDLRAASG